MDTFYTLYGIECGFWWIGPANLMFFFCNCLEGISKVEFKINLAESFFAIYIDREVGASFRRNLILPGGGGTFKVDQKVGDKLLK